MDLLCGLVILALALAFLAARRGRRHLLRRLEFLEFVLDSAAAFIFLVDSEGTVLWQSSAVGEVLGLDVVGGDIASIVHPSCRERFVTALWPPLGGRRDLLLGDVVILAPAGPLRVMFEWCCSPCGSLAVLTGRDITPALRELEKAAHRDHLTGLLNRAGFFAAVGRYSGRLCVLACDLDGLKQVNDTLGHEAGDALICRAASAIQSVLRAGDVVARAGGDEFWAVAFGSARGEEVCARLEGAAALHGVSLSVGFAEGESQDLESLLDEADRAMYRAKAARRLSCH